MISLATDIYISSMIGDLFDDRSPFHLSMCIMTQYFTVVKPLKMISILDCRMEVKKTSPLVI